jgi:NADPH:quinone reductase-like Zn-dependent oxidoreductase/acyl carrier protein
LSAAWQRGEELYAEVSLDPEQAGEAERFGVHPALLDAALHGLMFARDGEADAGGGVLLPFAWSDVSLYGTGASELRTVLRNQGEDATLTLHDSGGRAQARIGALAMRPIAPEQLQIDAPVKRQRLHAVAWRQLELPDHSELAADAELLRLAAEGGVEGAESARASAGQVLETLQGWLHAGHPAGSRLALLTQRAVATAEGESPDLPGAAVWGLVRSAQSEHPGCFVLIDSDGSEASEAAIPAALCSEEPQLALRQGIALVPRLAPASDRPGALVPPPGPWRLESTKPGTLEGLALVASPGAEEALGPDQVRVAVQAAGLNFRDVLIALGLYPGQATIGSEGSGIVAEVGSEVAGLAPGDRVMGLFGDAFAPLARAGTDGLALLPEGWSFEQGASVPAVFLTAMLGLCDLGGLKRGERVLVHAGAGGVGIAAIQLANRIGAEVFATASEPKWGVLEGLGVPASHIASSRDLSFEQKFLAQTEGEGVDVVLNSLAGEFVDASLRLLPRGGRFLEMGKSDIREQEQVAGDFPGVAYRAFALPEASGERVAAMLADVLALFERGELSHLPIEGWDLREAAEAFRHLREGRNVGKIVLGVPRPIDPDRTVLITGATGALGSAVARHLVEAHGARHLLLASRSGGKAEGAEELEDELGKLGAEATIAACDVSDRAQLEELLAKVPAKHPLGAVIHAAGAIEDATIEALGPAQIEAVFAPKADAAWHLHELTREMDLSAFVLFSSAAGVLGAPGQANYAAANSFLDALAQRRRAEGLPATSIAWGLWLTERGMTAELEEADLARLERSGVRTLAGREGLTLFDAALLAPDPFALAIGFDPAALRRRAAAGAIPSILAGLAGPPARRRSGSAAAFPAKLASLAEAERHQFVLETVRSEVAAVLGRSAGAEVAPERSFKDLGFDSLAAVELRNRLGALTGLRLAATAVFDHPNAVALAEQILALAGDDARGEGDSLASAFERMERALALISTDGKREQASARLGELIAGIDAEDAERDHDLGDASDEEMFELLDRKLGRV